MEQKGYRADQSNLSVAHEATPHPITQIAEHLDLCSDDLELYGKYKAKVSLDVLNRGAGGVQGKYIDVTAITPTPLGEGKSLITVGLSMALNQLGKRAIATMRQPSIGPVFGIKGGASGGGYAQIIPMEDVNLHMTGDIHAVSLAHNLLAAVIDAHLTHGNALDLDPFTIHWPRVVDLNDRALRQVIVGLGEKPTAFHAKRALILPLPAKSWRSWVWLRICTTFAIACTI
jgi:formate--tetrahydrofolate ligase